MDALDIMAFGPIILFIIVRTGLIKSWYIQERVPGVLSARMIFGLFPLGLGFTWLLFVSSLPSYDPDWIGNILPFVLCIVLIFYFMYRPPRWLVPRWLRWLEDEYIYCLDILVEDARKMNRWRWEAKVRTSEGIQTWVDGVLEQHHEEVEDRWFHQKLYLYEEQITSQGIYELNAGVIDPARLPKHRQNDGIVSEENIDKKTQRSVEMFKRTKAKKW